MHGEVVTKTEKTIRVRVTKFKVARIYGKLIKRHISYIVHNPNNDYSVGDTVHIIECRPMSKMKRFTVDAEATQLHVRPRTAPVAVAAA